VSEPYQPKKKEVAEVFGYPSHNKHATALDIRARHLCPFQVDETGQLRTCTKKSQHNLFVRFKQTETPFGACSVWHRGRGQEFYRPHIICPARFLQDNRIFQDAKRVLRNWRPASKFYVIREVNFPNIGRLDYILVNYDEEADELLDACILEVMAVSTTTTGDIIRSMFEILGLQDAAKETYNYGINFRQVISRMMIQLVAKSYATSMWNAKMIWVIQDVLYDYMVNSTNLALKEVSRECLEIAKEDILFFVYELETNPNHDLYRIRLLSVKGGTREDVKRSLEPKAIPSLDDWRNLILNNVRTANCFDLTDNKNVTPLPPSSDDNS